MSKIQELSIEQKHELMVDKLVKPGIEILENLEAIDLDLWHGVTGVCTEAGELLDAVKKNVIYNKPLDRINVVEELGDIEFYIAQVRRNLGISRQETLQANFDKLAIRYPNSIYTNSDAINRADKV